MTDLLAREPDLEMVAQAESLDEACQHCTSVELDAVILDLSLLDGNGADLILDVREANPAVGVLILSANLNPTSLQRVTLAGADEILDKLASPTEIVGTRAAALVAFGRVECAVAGEWTLHGPLGLDRLLRWTPSTARWKTSGAPSAWARLSRRALPRQMLGCNPQVTLVAGCRGERSPGGKVLLVPVGAASAPGPSSRSARACWTVMTEHGPKMTGGLMTFRLGRTGREACNGTISGSRRRPRLRPTR
jgi:CheY-like chemotaxis protein